MESRPPRLVWKFEDGPEDAEDEDPRDRGPAWLDTFVSGSDTPTTSAQVKEGEWITREEAQRLAKDAGYELLEDG